MVVELIGKLANHSEWTVEKHCSPADPDDEVELRGAITSIIPSFIKVLEDKNWVVRSDGIEVIGELANYGERYLKAITVQLTRSTKPSFGKPSQARFRRSIKRLKTIPGVFDCTVLTLLVNWQIMVSNS
jgi:hypothetical protein